MHCPTDPYPFPLPDDAATQTLANAGRLYRDARLLFEHERYASCVALSVLAAEELAKFMSLAGFQPLPQGDWRSHSAKQLGPASFLLRKRYQFALREIIAEQQVDDPDETYRRLARLDYGPEDEPLFDEVLARIVADGSLGRFTRVYGKEMDRLKQLSFYVDVDEEAQVRSLPSKITRETAQEQIDFVRDVLGSLRATMSHASG